MRYSIIILLLFCSNAFAAPVITYYEQSETEVIIHGTGFGTKAQQQPLVWDNFDTGSDGDLLTSHGWTKYSTAANGGWLESTNTYGATGLCAYNTPLTGNFNTSFRTYTESDDVYVTWMQRYDFTGGVAGSMKFLRINGGSDVYSSPLKMEFEYDILSWLRSYVRYDNNESNFYKNSAPIVQNGQWVRIEMYKECSTAGVADGKYYTRVNNQLAANVSNIMTRGTGITTQHSSVLLGLMMANSTATSLEMRNDNVYLDSSESRVEICNNESFSLAAQKEIQPYTQWSDTQITITINDVALSEGVPYFLNVVDSYGVVSNSVSITLGEEQQPVPIISLSSETIGIKNGDTFVLFGQNFGSVQGDSVVVIANNNVYDDSTIISTQNVTSWGDDSISFQANTSQFADGSINYIFVIKGTGQISNSYQISMFINDNPSDIDPTVSSISGYTDLTGEYYMENN